MPLTYKQIVTLATSTMVNDKPESVLIPKVLCSNEELKHVSECTACKHHEGLPNPYTVACNKPKDGDDKGKEG
jgi:hypothetical protein